MRFRFPLRFPKKFPLKFKEMDQESKAMAGVLVAFAIVVLGAVGLSQGQAGTPSLGAPGPRPSLHAKSGGLPTEMSKEQLRAKKKEKEKEKAEQAKANKSLGKLADSVDSSAPGTASKSEAPTSTPVTSSPKAEEPASSPAKDDSSAPDKPASDKPANQPKSAPKPQPAPSTLTSARVRALKNGADISSVASQLGPSLSRAELASRYGKDASEGMLAQEPAGRPCRYYALAPGEPAPLVRLCFDANGHLLTREFVAPQG